MQRFGFITLIIISTLFVGITSFAAPLPPPVKSAYNDFMTSYKSRDFKVAAKHGKIAWQQAEKLLGDSKTTGDLASNYGLLAARLGKYKGAVLPLTRGADLAHHAKENGPRIRIEREVELVEALILSDQFAEASDRVVAALDYAAANDLKDSIFTGELWVHNARIVHRKANKKAKHARRPAGGVFRKGNVEMIQSRSADYAQTALTIFDKHPKQTRPRLVSLAHKFIGFSRERNKEWLEAALAYQKAMLIQKEYSDLSHASYATTIGRWLNARNHVARDGRSNGKVKRDRKSSPNSKSDRLKKLGICKCWPFEGEKNIQAEVIKRVPPKMPARATTSGFSIVKFDLSDDGKVINPKIVYSWPKKMYDKSSMRSINQWQYEAKADGAPGAQREGIVTTINYLLQTRSGNPI